MTRDSRDWRRAADLYREHLTANPGDFGIWVQMGHCVKKKAGNFAEAEVCYRSALELSPDDADLWLQIGHLKKLLLRFEEAAAAYRKSLLLILIRNLRKASFRGLKMCSPVLRTRG